MKKDAIFLVLLCSYCNNTYLYWHWLHYCCVLRIAAVMFRVFFLQFCAFCNKQESIQCFVVLKLFDFK